jgi:hypothetical protein
VHFDKKYRVGWKKATIFLGHTGSVVLNRVILPFLFLNREGARDAKGVFGWVILILEERFRIKIPNR